jgi:hypothetical protein
MQETRTDFRYIWFGGCVRSPAAILCVSALALSGCAGRQIKAKPFPWGTAAHSRPVLAVASISIEGTVDDVPDLQLDVAPPPSPLILVRSAPLRPRVAANSSGASEAASKPDVPQIAPQLSPAETAAAQEQTNQSLEVAQRNVSATQGKSLNATQLDLASKIRSFIAEAREAANTGDWTRARNAAKKAQVLSEELASSL